MNPQGEALGSHFLLIVSCHASNGVYGKIVFQTFLPALVWFPFHFLSVKGTLPVFRFFFPEEILPYIAVGLVYLWKR